jgi:uncharacterized protein YbaR (Trm112 family)
MLVPLQFFVILLLRNSFKLAKDWNLDYLPCTVFFFTRGSKPRKRYEEAVMEFFVCPCTKTGHIILDGNDQGPNKDSSGKLLTKQCNAGFHTISLKLSSGVACSPLQAHVDIYDTDPISPREVPFQCA